MSARLDHHLSNLRRYLCAKYACQLSLFFKYFSTERRRAWLSRWRQYRTSRCRAPISIASGSGAVNVIALSDGTVPQDLYALLTNTTQAKTDALLEVSFLRNPIEASINVFLIALPDRLVLVDTGSGELFGPGNGGKLLSSLAAAGYRPEQITDILITHVHTDHRVAWSKARGSYLRTRRSVSESRMSTSS